MPGLISFLQIGFLAVCVVAQYPSTPLGITKVKSTLQPGVELSYKETSICETSAGVKSYSGYVHLPATTLGDIGDYDISTYFWYFEARHNPNNAPLAIYLAGGPGEPSVYPVISGESGPCHVNPAGNSTTLNPWSFNNHVNMLYIDQPVQTGFSYSSLINGTISNETGQIVPNGNSTGTPEPDPAAGPGTFRDENPLKTTNTSITSAKALWHFAENWLTQFPEFTTKDKRISVWGNSYGGYWAPAVMAYFDKQLKSLAQKEDHQLCGFRMDTLGITNGCIDLLASAPSYPAYAHNNSYNLQLFSDSVYESANHNFTKPGGCRDLTLQCRALGEQGDPEWTGNNQTVNEACTLATQFCYAFVFGDLNTIANRSNFDISLPAPDFFPIDASITAYLNQPIVQSALGVPLNYTTLPGIIQTVYSLNVSPSNTYIGTGDGARRTLAELEYALQNDIKVAMVYGDRDYRCNWLGAEAVALAADYKHAEKFRQTEYKSLKTNGSYVGGEVRQYGKFSFSRIFEAGHGVSAYQPETVYRVFMRAMFGLDVATGEKKEG